jgi:hypothetical protein
MMLSVHAEVMDQDLGMDRMIKGLAKLGELSITIGYQGEKAEIRHGIGTATVVEVAAFQEFGTVRIPERPSLRTALQEKQSEISDMFNKAINNVIDGKDPVSELSEIGEKAAEFVRQRIRDAKGWAVPLAPSTIARKKSDAPLRETDQMIEAVSWAVRKGDQVLRQG